MLHSIEELKIGSHTHLPRDSCHFKQYLNRLFPSYPSPLSQNWSEARMPIVTIYVSSDDGLGNEDIYSPRPKWHPVDTLEAVG